MSSALAPIAATAVNVGGQLALSYASSAISRLFDNRTFEGPRLESFRVMSSTDGAPLPRIYGRARVGGQVIWASNLKEHVEDEKVGKGGGPTQRDYSYTISFAVALCEGEIAGVERVWANGEIIPTAGLTMRVHKGTEDQLPDPVITATDGYAPAYRGTAYVVFEDFPLDAFGARLPQMNFEVVRSVPRQDDGPRLEDLVTGVNLLPSSGEFAYETRIIEEVRAPGANVPINLNNPSGLADAVRAVEQLEDQLPNCRSVSIISSWFGTDLRAGHCEIRPGVETRERLVFEADDWRVGDLTRSDAYLVSQVDGSPVYGGTPSDASLIHLIRLLKERGFEVGLYPFILMDVPEENSLPDPYGGVEQAAFPWRGRIVAGGSDDIAAFFGAASASDFTVSGDVVVYGGDTAFGFRRFILHHAAIAQAAGGVDRFVIGSEMVGLTTSVPDGGYPAVAELVDLAREAKAMLPGAKVTYAADWTEYRGHQVGGDITYHLDPLWSSPDIDLVAIDAYFPLSDWREGEHLDAELAPREHDLDYLTSNVEGGEGYDWFYASREDRDAQLRSPITDPVYAYKNVRHWWGSQHFDRVDGVEAETPTAWVPGSKPIWFSEIGCPAVNFGANQPNVFVDPKSSESFLPYHSSGLRDDLIQRNYLRAFVEHYQDDPMVDGMHVWCWDARPFPDFPARGDVWADGPNWQLGHWLSGRMGRVALADLIADVCKGLEVECDVSGLFGLIEGVVLDRPQSVRASLQGLCEAFGIDLVEAEDKLVFRSRQDSAPVDVGDLLADAAITITRTDPDLAPNDVRLRFIDSARDHQPGLVSGARRIGTDNAVELNLPVVMDSGFAESIASARLEMLQAAGVEVEGYLAPDHGLRVGDRIALPKNGEFRLLSLDGPSDKGVAFAGVAEPDTAFVANLGGSIPAETGPIAWASAPALFAFDLPGMEGLAVGARLEPWRSVDVESSGGRITLTAPLHIGYLATGLSTGPVAVTDVHTRFEIGGLDVQVEAVSDTAWQSGANRFAVETSSGWEILAARDVELVGPGRYRCAHLLRGLHGSPVVEVAAGARAVWLGSGVEALPLSGEIGERVALRASAGGRTTEIVHTVSGAHLRPLAPIHVSAKRSGGGVDLGFAPRLASETGWSGFDDGNGRRFRVEWLDAEGEVLEDSEIAATDLKLSAPETATHVRVSEGVEAYGWGAAATAPITSDS